MEPKIITKDEFKVLGYELLTTAENGESSKEIPAFWKKIMGEKKLEKIPNQIGRSCLGICRMIEKNSPKFSYTIGIEVNKIDKKENDMISITVPKSKYAVFTVKGLSKEIQDGWKEICNEWLPKSKYQHAGTPDFELYDERFDGSENSETDIYIPIKEK